MFDDSILPEVPPLVMTKLSIGHVSMVPDDLADVLRRHVFLLSVHKAKLSLFGVALCLQVLPFSCCRVGGHLKQNEITSTCLDLTLYF